MTILSSCRRDRIKGKPLSDQAKRALDGLYSTVGKLEGAGKHREARIVENAVTEAFYKENMDYVHALQNNKRIPVCIDEFIESEDFLGNMMNVWPELRGDLREMHPDHMAGDGDAKTEVILGGATGWGKSVILQISTMYVMYFLSCFHKPQHLWRNLSDKTPLVIPLQSVQERVTNRVLYNPIRDMFTTMPFVMKYIKWDKYKERVLILEKGIELVPALASIQSILGSATVAAGLDEVNFMDVVQQSKQVAGARGQGGHYDQAEELYTTLTGRRIGRFITKGPNPGGIYLSSSAHYEDDFLARRVRQIREHSYNHVMVRERAQYDARPADTFSGETFPFLVGTDQFPPKILDPDEPEPDNGDVRHIPVEYQSFFEVDAFKAQRDVLGIASNAISRFIPQVDKIVDAVVRGKENGLEPFVEVQNVEYEAQGLPVINEDNLPADRGDNPRFVHVDLSLTSDRCGIAMSKVVGYEEIENEDGVVEVLPKLQCELAVSIQPSVQKELDIAAVRRWILALQKVHGFYIYMVTYDGFQSKESIQVLRKAGIRSDVVSMDKTTEPYEVIKRALMEDRLDLVDNPIMRKELLNLEHHKGSSADKKRKVEVIDHPPKGSKDISDAVAGSCYTASRSRLVRNQIKAKDMEQTSAGSSAVGMKTARTAKRKRRSRNTMRRSEDA